MWKICLTRGRHSLSGTIPACLGEASGVEAVVGSRLIEASCDRSGRYRVEFTSRRRVLLAAIHAHLGDGRRIALGHTLCINLGRAGQAEGSDLARQLSALSHVRIPPAPARRMPPPEGARWSIQWIIPDFHAGAGGLMNVFRLARELETAGHKNTFWLMRATRHSAPAEYVRKHYAPLSAEFKVLRPGEVGRVAGDVVVATNAQSAWFARGVSDVAAKVYLIQDYEPHFRPAGTEACFDRATYSFGFKAVAAGPWLRAMLERDGHPGARTFDFVCDPAFYHLANQPRARGAGRRRIAFYARASTPRRAVPLGLRALELLAAARDDFEVHLFGQNHGGLSLPFPHVDRGVLTPAELGQLYRECEVGMVFSATNHSIAPLEMMACGLPVLELDGENNSMVYPSDAILLARPEPEAIAKALARLLDDHELAARLRAGGLAHAKGKTWPRAGAAVESAIAEALAEGAGRTV